MSSRLSSFLLPCYSKVFSLIIKLVQAERERNDDYYYIAEQKTLLAQRDDAKKKFKE